MVATFPSRFCAHCYCFSCRTTHSAGVVTWIGFKREQVRITRGAELVRDYVSSQGTRRKFCTQCGTTSRSRASTTTGAARCTCRSRSS